MKCFYHGTAADRVHSILQHGLLPGPDALRLGFPERSQLPESIDRKYPYAYLTSDLETATVYAICRPGEEGAILQVFLPDDYEGLEPDTWQPWRSFRVAHAIPPEHIGHEPVPITFSLRASVVRLVMDDLRTINTSKPAFWLLSAYAAAALLLPNSARKSDSVIPLGVAYRDPTKVKP